MVDLHIAGAVRARLTVGSDAEDASFPSERIELLPDGRGVDERDGTRSLAFREDAGAGAYARIVLPVLERRG